MVREEEPQIEKDEAIRERLRRDHPQQNWQKDQAYSTMICQMAERERKKQVTAAGRARRSENGQKNGIKSNSIHPGFTEGVVAKIFKEHGSATKFDPKFDEKEGHGMNTSEHRPGNASGRGTIRRRK